MAHVASMSAGERPGHAHTGGDRQSVPYCDKSFPGQTISVVVVDWHCVELARGATRSTSPCQVNGGKILKRPNFFCLSSETSQ